MKKIGIYIVLACMMSSCSDFLKEDMVSGVGYDFLKTPAGIEGAVNHVYSNMKAHVGGESNYVTLAEYGTDYNWTGYGSATTFYQYNTNLNPDNSTIKNFWDTAFNGINGANTALMMLPEVKGITDIQKEQFGAEMRFMRAYHYFDLVQQFGGVPILEKGNVSEIITYFERATTAEVYDFIIKDLRKAIDVLPETPAKIGKPTTWAAQTLLAQVYLTRGSAVSEQRGQKSTDIDSTLFYALSVIDKSPHELESDYFDIFDFAKQKSSKEVIFALQGTIDVLFNGSGNTMHLYWVSAYEGEGGMMRTINYGRGFARLRPSTFVFDKLYDKANDSRYYKTFRWAWLCNNKVTIPKWQQHYYYVNAKGSTTTEIIYSPPANLVGKPKFEIGDTAILFSPLYYGAKDREGKVIDEAKSKQMQIDIAKCSYKFIPIDNHTPRLYPEMVKYYDDRRLELNQAAGSRNWVRLRLGEVYLMAAEAYGRKADYTNAAYYINELRKRAAFKDGEKNPFFLMCGGDTANNGLSTESENLVKESDLQTNFIDFMLEERARETYGELSRWIDLVRVEKLAERLPVYSLDAKVGFKSYHRFRPIPQAFIDRLIPTVSNSDVQNEGYY